MCAFQVLCCFTTLVYLNVATGKFRRVRKGEGGHTISVKIKIGMTKNTCFAVYYYLSAILVNSQNISSIIYMSYVCKEIAVNTIFLKVKIHRCYHFRIGYVRSRKNGFSPISLSISSPMLQHDTTIDEAKILLYQKVSTTVLGQN